MHQKSIAVAAEPAPAFVALAHRYALTGTDAAIALVRVISRTELGGTPQWEREAFRRDLELAVMAWVKACGFAETHIQILLQSETEHLGRVRLRPRLIPLQYRVGGLVEQARSWLPTRKLESALAGLEEAVLAAGYRA